MTMEQITEGRAPNALVSGFGDLVEELAMKTPSVMIYSYAPPNWKNQAKMWAKTVQWLKQTKQLLDPPAIFGLQFKAMKPRNYAEAWSFVSYLAREPRTFEAGVLAIRDERAKPLDAFLKEYRVDAKRLVRGWRTFIARKR